MNKNENKLIPELRFPEFVNEGEWEEKTLKDVCEITNGKANVQDHIENGKYPLFDRSEVIKSTDNFIFDCEAVIIPGEGMRFIPKYYKGKFNLHQRAYALKDFISDGKFVYFSMLHKSNLLSQKAVQSTVLSLRLPILQDFPIETPKNPTEQQKIASCLSSLDELITAHTDKLETLKIYKKGLMQNLFPQEGEKVPKLRFKEFEKNGMWMEEKLESISIKIMVGIASAATQAYRKSGIILFRNQNIKEGFLDDKDILFLDEDYEKEHKNKRLKAGDLLTARTGYPGVTCVVPEKYEGSQSFTTLITRPNTNFIISAFLCYYINSEKGQAFFKAAKIGGGQQNVNAGSLIDMPIFFPSKIEQQKIADTLSSLDELIKEQANKIEELKSHKKGLMQGLFPKMKN